MSSRVLVLITDLCSLFWPEGGKGTAMRNCVSHVSQSVKACFRAVEAEAFDLEGLLLEFMIWIYWIYWYGRSGGKFYTLWCIDIWLYDGYDRYCCIVRCTFNDLHPQCLSWLSGHCQSWLLLLYPGWSQRSMSCMCRTHAELMFSTQTRTEHDRTIKRNQKDGKHLKIS